MRKITEMKKTSFFLSKSSQLRVEARYVNSVTEA